MTVGDFRASASVILADTCMSCPSGSAPPEAPLSTEDVHGWLRALYRCRACGTEWLSTWVPGAPENPVSRRLADYAAQIRLDLACRHCESEVRVTEGSRGWRARVVHAAGCPWLPVHQAGRDPGCIPCSTTVTHRGPYKRDPERRAAA